MVPIRKLRKNLHLPNNPSEGIYNGYAARELPIESILIHSTNGNADSSFENEVHFLYNSRAVTSEYEVGALEIVEHLDPRQYYGFHAGNVRNRKYSNPRSIGIEVHYSPRDTKPIDPRIIQNLTDLVKYLMVEYNLTPNDISTHRAEAIPKGRKSDPSFWNDEQFLKWKSTLQSMETFTALHAAPIYTDPALTTRAIHINTPEIQQGILPIGFTFTGKRINQVIWMANGWGFVPIYILEGHVMLNGTQVDPIYLQRALNKWATHLTVPQKDSIVSAYTAYGELTTLGNIFPFAQAVKETGWFASDRWKKSFNPAGLGATDDGAWGGHFDTAAAGIFAQYAHLLCYAATDTELNALQQMIARLSPRRAAVMREYGLGVAKNSWLGLSLKWNSPTGNKNYGQEIITLGEKIMRL